MDHHSSQLRFSERGDKSPMERQGWCRPQLSRLQVNSSWGPPEQGKLWRSDDGNTNLRNSTGRCQASPLAGSSGSWGASGAAGAAPEAGSAPCPRPRAARLTAASPARRAWPRSPPPCPPPPSPIWHHHSLSFCFYHSMAQCCNSALRLKLLPGHLLINETI